jgi:multimeric flavodoxin WrbA
MKTSRIPIPCPAVKALLRGTDGIIRGSPTYGGAPKAIMKNLLDRLGSFERFTSATFGGKYIVGMSTARSAGDARELTSLRNPAPDPSLTFAGFAHTIL